MVAVVEINFWSDMKNTFIIILCCLSLNVFGQNKKEVLKGKVTFVTSKNVYVRFESTALIKVGDSLKLANSSTSCLLVKNKSSKSLVCVIIGNCEVKKDAVVEFFYHKTFVKSQIIRQQKNENTKTTVVKKSNNVKDLENISGKISLATYSNFYANRDNKHRVMARFSMYADHINNSNFSFETYLNYRNEVAGGKRNFSPNKYPFKVYNMALKYNDKDNLFITVGRKINNKTSSLGAIDGLQVEKHFGQNYVGVISGFRPDITSYTFNSKLFQYGVYVGRQTQSANIFSQTTLGFIEQRNGGKVDRRYTYFQHSSNLFNSLSLFSSLELDIYNKVNGIVSNNFRLTNLYLSARYRFSRKANLSLSYDSRKRIIFYETFQSDIERLLSDDIARQGLRLRLNTKPFKFVNAGISYSTRFQSDSQNKSENINVYASMYRIPNIGGSFSINYNRNTSNFLESNIISVRHSRMAFKNRLSTTYYFRFVNYNYTSTESGNNYYYFGTDLSININRSLRLGVYAEYVKSDIENNYRFNTKIVQRFNNKKKKRKYVY